MSAVQVPETEKKREGGHYNHSKHDIMQHHNTAPLHAAARPCLRIGIHTSFTRFRPAVKLASRFLFLFSRRVQSRTAASTCRHFLALSVLLRNENFLRPGPRG